MHRPLKIHIASEALDRYMHRSYATSITNESSSATGSYGSIYEAGYMDDVTADLPMHDNHEGCFTVYLAYATLETYSNLALQRPEKLRSSVAVSNCMDRIRLALATIDENDAQPQRHGSMLLCIDAYGRLNDSTTRRWTYERQLEATRQGKLASEILERSYFRKADRVRQAESAIHMDPPTEPVPIVQAPHESRLTQSAADTPNNTAYTMRSTAGSISHRRRLPHNMDSPLRRLVHWSIIVTVLLFAIVLLWFAVS